MTISEIIANVSNILVYFLPGRIFIFVFSYLLEVKMKDSYYIPSVCISYIILSVVRLFEFDISTNLETGIVVVLAIVLSAILGLIVNSKPFERLHIFLTRRSMSNSMWDEIMDDRDTFIKVFIPTDKVTYYGLYKGHEGKEDNNYILITDYEITDYNGVIIKDFSKDRACWATLSTKDISRVEVFYTDESKKATKPNCKKKKEQVADEIVVNDIKESN